MAGQWDSAMKSLVGEEPQDFVTWLVKDAVYEGREESQLRSRKIDVDGLYRVSVHGQPYLLHIEFQKRSDPQMEQRLWEYNLLATRQHGVPVYSYVLYLVKERRIARSPYQVLLGDGLPVHEFRFWPIKLWEVETEEVVRTGREGLLPLVPLTREGQSRDAIDQVIEMLYDKGQNPKTNLLALTYGLAALVMTDEQDQEWLKRRFGMLDEILKESWAFKELRQEAWDEGLEEGKKEGLEQGLERGLEQGLEEALFSLVEARFPNLLSLARERRSKLTSHATLQKLVVQMGIARSEEEARAFLN